MGSGSKPTKPSKSVAAANEVSSAGGAEETPEEKQRAYVEARSSELMGLAMNDDSDSLHTILSELTNREPEIRKAAVQAAVQFGSRDAIPALMDAALQTDDPHEKAAIADAIEFLKLPSLTEVMEEKKNATAADAAGTSTNR
jgi:HEAT repeat protein